MSGVITTNYVLNQPDPPPTPDYKGAAEATAAGNRVNQFTPWGSSVWSAPPEGSDTWSQDIRLTPEQQRIFDLNQQTDATMAQTGLTGLQNVQGMFNTPYSTGLAPIEDYSSERQGIMDNMLSRVNTDIDRDIERKGSELIAQGIPKGSEAWNRETEAFARQRTDARQQAELASTRQVGELQSQNLNQRRQSIVESLQERQQPLNELNAFRTGTQVGMPQFPGTPAGPDYLTAEGLRGQYDLAGWNADISQRNAIMGGLFGVGAGFAGAPRGGGKPA